MMLIVIKLLIMVLLALINGLMIESVSGREYIDISHSYNKDTLHWLTMRPFELKVIQNGTIKGGDDQFWIQIDEIHMAVHTGTHIDAPCHFNKGGWTMSEIPHDNFMDRPIAVIDVSEQCLRNRDYLASVDDAKDWEKTNGKIPDRAVVIIKTGWARFWPNKLEYFGTDTTDTSLAHFPGIGPDLAKWLVENRSIVGVGIDGPSVDNGRSFDKKTHRILAVKSMYNIENVAKGVHKLPPIGAKLMTLPLKLDGGCGCPATVVAYIDSGAASITAKITLSIMFLSIVFLNYIIN